MREVTLEEVLDVINVLDDNIITCEQLDDNLPDLGMDSIKFIQIIVGLEEAFDCEFPDSKLIITEMDTVQKIMDILQKLYDEQNQ